MESSTARQINRILFYLYSALGTILFIFPSFSAENFAWKVTPGIAMTIGGWCLGNAFMAWKASQIWRWKSIYAVLIYLWTFGILQTLVLILFRDKFILPGFVSYLYVAALLVNLLSAGVGIKEWINSKARLTPEGPPLHMWVRLLVIPAAIFVTIVTIFMFINPTPILKGEILPQNISLFTVYAFAMFYIAIFAGGVASMIGNKAGPIYYLSQGGVALVIPITTAALVTFTGENFIKQPGVISYIGLYTVILIGALSVSLYYHSKINKNS